MSNTKKCDICGTTFQGYGNNPSPFKGNTCCDKCNTEIVIPLRFYHINIAPSSAILFKTNGTVETIKPKGKWFTLEELQGLVGGLIELYPRRLYNRYVVCNEEGLLKELPTNTMFQKFSGITLVGDIIVCPEHIFEESE